MCVLVACGEFAHGEFCRVYSMETDINNWSSPPFIFCCGEGGLSWCVCDGGSVGFGTCHCNGLVF